MDFRGVDDAEVGGACGGDDGHRDRVVRVDRQQARIERFGVHAPGRVGRDGDDRLGVESEEEGCAGDGEVSLVGGEDAQAGQLVTAG
jgi:hypothetical protein